MKKILSNSVMAFRKQLIWIFLFPSLLCAQPYVDILNIKYQHFGEESYTGTSPNKLGGSISEATVLLPLEQKDSSVIFAGFDYSRLNFISTKEKELNAQLYSMSLQVGYDYKWKNGKWRTMAMVIPKMNSDKNKSGSDDFQAGGVLLFNYKKNENLHYHFGLYYNREFFGDYFTPLLGIEWKINDKTNLFGDLPSNLNIEYKINTSFYTGAGIMTNISSYRIHSSSQIGYVREGDAFWGHDQVKLFLNWYMTPHLVLFAEVGETFNRTFVLFDDENNEINDPTSTFGKSKDGMFITGGLAYRYRLEK